jgi:hypothetical protein
VIRNSDARKSGRPVVSGKIFLKEQISKVAFRDNGVQLWGERPMNA